MNEDSLLAISYIGIWSLIFLFYYRIKKTFDCGGFILLTYIVYSICSYRLLNSEYYSFNRLSVFPYVYLFFCMLIGIYPILKADFSGRYEVVSPSLKVTNCICLIFITSSFANSPSSIMKFSEGIRLLLVDSTAGNDMYEATNEYSKSTGDGITNIFAIFTGAFSNIGIFMMFYYLTLNKINHLILWGLIVSCLLLLIAGISSGQRGPVIEPLLLMVATYFMFENYIHKFYRKVIRFLGIILIVLISIPIIAITLSRFDNSVSDPLESTYFYVGQQNLYFNNYALDDNGIRYGDRTIPLFKRLLLIPDVPKNYWERRIKYPHLKVNDEVFITYVGDIAIDFGPIICLILFLLYFCLIPDKTSFMNGRIELHKLVLLHMIVYLCTIGGLKLYPLADVHGNLKVIVYFACYYLIKNQLKMYSNGR